MKYRKIKNIIQLSAITVLLGRGWQHLYWDAPFRSVLWDENWMGWLVVAFGGKWENFITSSQADQWIQFSIQAHGFFYVCGAVVALLIYRIPKFWSKWVLGTCSVLLIILAVLYSKEKSFSIGQFFEYSLQFSSPILLYLVVHRPEKMPSWISWMRWATALTFACHGLYAVNYYPRPGNFVEMTLNILPIEEAAAYTFLNFAGIADFVIAVAVLLIRGRWIIPFLAYAVIWGFLTAVARIVAYVEIEFFTESMLQWFHESILRFPHFLIPLALLYFFWGEKSQSKNLGQTH